MRVDQTTVDRVVTIVEAAGAAIMEIYDADFAVEYKDDSSPLTQADLAAHKIIVAGLEAAFPSIPILSEEAAPAPFSERSQWSQYWLVDPLDGTKEFVNRNGEFTVNIALIENNEAVLGVVGVPVQKQTYTGDVTSGIARVLHEGDTIGRDLLGKPRAANDVSISIVASRNHGGERLESYLDAVGKRFPELSRNAVGSSLKLCTLAAGGADLYPRLGPTSEWDIAAAHAVLRAAGGDVVTPDGETMRYNTKESVLNPDFLAVADRRFNWMDALPQFPVD